MTADALRVPSMSNRLLKGHVVMFPYHPSFFDVLSREVTIQIDCDFVPRSLLVCRDFEFSHDAHRYMLALSDHDDLQEILYYIGSVDRYSGYSPKPCRIYRAEALPSLSFHTILLALGRIDPRGDYLHQFQECHFLMDMFSDDMGTAMFRHHFNLRVFYGVRMQFCDGHDSHFNHEYYPRRSSMTEESEYNYRRSSMTDQWSYGFPCTGWFHGPGLPPGPMIPPWTNYSSSNPGTPMEHAANVLRRTITEDRLAGRPIVFHLLRELYFSYPESNAFVQALHYLR